MVSYAVLQGIGQAARRDRERQDADEQVRREQATQTRQSFLQHLDRIANSEDWPEETRTAAASGALAAIMDPKFDEKRASKIWESVWRSSARPAPPTMGERAASQVNDSAPAIGMGLDALAPGAGSMFTGAARLTNERIPPAGQRPQYTGMLRPDEKLERQNVAGEVAFQNAVRLYRAQQQVQREMNPQIETREGHDGFYTFDKRTGKQVGFKPYSTPKTPAPDRSLSPMEVELNALDPKDPQYKEKSIEIARRYGTLQYTNQGDNTNSGGAPGAGKPVRLTTSLLQNPDGSLVQVLTDPYDPDKPPVVRQLGGNLGKVATDASKDKRANLEQLLVIAKRVRDSAAKNSGAIGWWDSMVGKTREFTGGNPEAVTWMRTDVRDMASQLGLLRSGQAVSEQEAARLASLLPDTGKSESDFKAKAARFASELEAILTKRYGPVGTGPTTATGNSASAPQIGSIITVQGKRYKVVGINPQTGKPQVQAVP